MEGSKIRRQVEGDGEGGIASDKVVREGLSEEMTSELRPRKEEGVAMHSGG